MNEGVSSPREAVCDLVARLKAEKRLPTDFELGAVKPGLERMAAAVRKVRAMGPEFATVDLSDEVWALVKLAEKPSMSEWSRSILRRLAATFIW